MTAEMIDVYSRPHPFRLEREHCVVPEGSTLAQMIEAVQPDPALRGHALVYVGEKVVPANCWPYVRPKAGAEVAIRIVPQGGGGDKNVTRTILLVAVAAVSAGVASGWLGSGAGTWFAGGSASALAAAAAVSMIGRLAVDAIAPPPTPDGGMNGTDQDAPVPGIENARNRLQPFGIVPRTFGTDRVVPPLAARTFTEIQGNDQYLRMAVVWGYGPIELTDLRIGDTPVHQYDDVLVSHDFGDGNGFTNGNRFSKDVSQRNLQVTLDQSAGWVTRTTEPDVDEISVDVTWPQGLVEFTDAGNKRSRLVEVELQYAPIGTSDWSVATTGESISSTQVTVSDPGSYYSYSDGERKSRVSTDLVYIDQLTGNVRVEQGERFGLGSIVPPTPRGGVALAEVTVSGTNLTTLTSASITSVANRSRPSDTFGSGSDFQVTKSGALTVDVSSGTIKGPVLAKRSKRTSTVRESYAWTVPQGQYDVRLRRVTPDSSNDQIRDLTAWTALRSIKHENPVQMDGIAQTHLIIRATDQLNGIIDQLNGLVTSVVPDYDADSGIWIERATNNPASHARHILQGEANDSAIGDSRLDLAAFESLHQRCESENFTFDYTFQRETSVKRALQKVLSVCRATPTLVDGKWSLVVDEPGKTVVQTFTEKSSKGFRATKRFGKQPHALRVQFTNADKGYQRDEVIVYDDGYDANNATEFEGMETEGIIVYDNAWREGRFHLAQNRLRPETYELDVDIAHLVATRGDVIRVRHDVPLWGSGSGRVKSVQTDGSGNITGVTVDETLELIGGTDYVMRFAFVEGGDLLRDIEDVSSDTATSTVTFVDPIPTAQGPAAGDQFLFGIKDQESVRLLIKAISRASANPDHDVTLTLVDESPAVHDADQNIPAFDSQITVEEPFDGNRPPQPVVTEIQSDEDVLVVGPNGTVQPRIVITYEIDSSAAVQPDTVEARYKAVEESSGYEYRRFPASAGQMVLDDIEVGEDYQIDLRSLESEQGIASPWRSAETSYRVVGTANPPEAITGLTIQIVSSLAVLRWDRNPDLDVRVGGRIEMRHSRHTSGATWQNSVSIGDAVAGNVTEAVLPLRKGTYLIRAVDAGGRKGPIATVPSSAARAIAFTTLDSVQEHPTFPGMTNDTTVDDLRATPALKLAGQGLFDDIPDFDAISNLDAYGGVELSGEYTFDTGIDLGTVKPVQIDTVLDVVIANVNDFIDDRTDPIDQWADFDGSEAAEGNASVWVRSTEDDPNASPTWSTWERVESADYEGRAFQFQARLSVTDPSYNVFVEELSANVKEAA